MHQALILHGTMSNPKGNWFPWLKSELKKLGVKTYVPKLPTPQNQTIDNWLQIMDQTIKSYNSHTLLIGHSSAPLAICAKLQQLDRPVQAAFFIAPFYGFIGNQEYDEYNRHFVNYRFDWDKVRQGASKFYLYRSDNDPYVPEDIGAALAQKLQAKETIIPHAGHLNAESGYTQFPQLLDDIKQEIQ